MGLIAKFCGLSSSRRRLVITSAGLLLLVRVGLRVFPYQRVQDRLDRFARSGSEGTDNVGSNGDVTVAESVVWAVNSAAARIPGTTCLPRALVGRYLLRCAGCHANIRFGVNKGMDGVFAAHAWLESRDQVLLGGDTLLEYTPLKSWPTDAT